MGLVPFHKEENNLIYLGEYMEEIKTALTDKKIEMPKEKKIEALTLTDISSFGDFYKDEDILVDARNIEMTFNMPQERIDNLKEYAIRFIKGKLNYKKHEVLKNINIQVRRGDSLALLGRNGAGKSTLLRILAGIIEPTGGYVRTRGNIVPLLQLGAGFDGDATGRENVFLNGAMMGFSKREMMKKYDSIVEFSELKEFMNVPLKNYSSGMKSRLGFAIAVDVNPDLMMVDEILSVGDNPFQEKCARKIDELKKKGTTFIVVSHSMNQIRRLCENAVYLKDGEMVLSGPAEVVTKAYEADCKVIAEEARKQDELKIQQEAERMKSLSATELINELDNKGLNN